MYYWFVVMFRDGHSENVKAHNEQEIIDEYGHYIKYIECQGKW